MSLEGIRVVCSVCGSAGQVVEHLAGSTIRCMQCGQSLVVPRRPDSNTAATDAESPIERYFRESGPPIEQLIEELSDPNESIRRGAIAVLAGMGKLAKPAIKELTGAMRDESSIVRQWAVQALSGIGFDNEETVLAILPALNDSERKIRAVAQVALKKMGPASAVAVPPLIRTLQTGSTDTRLAVCQVLQQIGPGARAAATELVNAMLSDTNIDVRRCAAFALRHIEADPNVSVPGLARALKDPDTEVRMCAIIALGTIGSMARDAIPELIAVMQTDSSPKLREAAELAMGRMND